MEGFGDGLRVAGFGDGLRLEDFGVAGGLRLEGSGVAAGFLLEGFGVSGTFGLAGFGVSGTFGLEGLGVESFRLRRPDFGLGLEGTCVFGGPGLEVLGRFGSGFDSFWVPGISFWVDMIGVSGTNWG